MYVGEKGGGEVNRFSCMSWNGKNVLDFLKLLLRVAFGQIFRHVDGSSIARIRWAFKIVEAEKVMSKSTTCPTVPG